MYVGIVYVNHTYKYCRKLARLELIAIFFFFFGFVYSLFSIVIKCE
jgi:hypothetical protein